jgi:hypothetical protein
MHSYGYSWLAMSLIWPRKNKCFSRVILFYNWVLSLIIPSAVICGLWKLTVETIFFYYFQKRLNLHHQKAIASANFI